MVNNVEGLPFKAYSTEKVSLSIHVEGTRDIHKIPLTFYLTNSEEITGYQVYIQLPTEQCKFLYEKESGLPVHKVYRQRGEYRSYDIGLWEKEYQDMYLFAHSNMKLYSFTGNSGKLVTLYFDGSSLPPGTYTAQIYRAILHRPVDVADHSHFYTEKASSTFVIKDKEVTHTPKQ